MIGIHRPRSLPIAYSAMLLSFTLLSAGAEEKPRTDPLCTLESPSYRVDFVSGQYCCPNKLGFWVENRATGVEGLLEVETQVKRADKMILVNESKIFVTGYLERGAKGLAIVDLETGALQDELHTYDYRFSPSRKQLVYSRRYENSDPSMERCPLLLLYDLTGTAEDNRAGSPARLDIANAGIPIYPEANARARSYDPRLEPPHRYLSPLVWSEDELRLTFFERFEDKYWLVILDLSEGISPPVIRKTEVRLSDLASDANAESAIHLATLYWKDEQTVEVQALIGGVFHEGVEVVVR